MNEQEKLLIEEYAREHDPEYGSCSTCKCYGKAYICCPCSEGSEYVFSLSSYVEDHREELKKELGLFSEEGGSVI